MTASFDRAMRIARASIAPQRDFLPTPPNALYAIRRRIGISQEEMAERMGIDHSTYARQERRSTARRVYELAACEVERRLYDGVMP